MRLPMYAWNRKDNLAKFEGLVPQEEFECIGTHCINKNVYVLESPIQSGFYLRINKQHRNEYHNSNGRHG